MTHLLYLGLGTMESSLIGIITLVLVIFCIVDIMKSGKGSTDKLLWVLIVIIAPLLGSIIYLLFGRERRTLRL